MKLTLQSADARVISDNFYWIPRRDEDHQLLNQLPPVNLTGTAILVGNTVEVELTNTAPAPALLIKPTLRTSDGQRVLPVYASDGCFSLLPGEKRRFTLEAPAIPAGKLQVTAEGWNLGPTSVSVLRN